MRTGGPDIKTLFSIPGLNETDLQKAKLFKASMEKNEEATREMKRIGEEELERARKDYDAAQKLFSDAVTLVPPSRGKTKYQSLEDPDGIDFSLYVIL